MEMIGKAAGAGCATGTICLLPIYMREMKSDELLIYVATTISFPVLGSIGGAVAGIICHFAKIDNSIFYGSVCGAITTIPFVINILIDAEPGTTSTSK
jgi:hypothetical protein